MFNLACPALNGSFTGPVPDSYAVDKVDRCLVDFSRMGLSGNGGGAIKTVSHWLR